MRIALGVEYQGSGFSGWQFQDQTRTAQGELDKALSQIANHPVTTTCAGRTDSGVNASGQIVHFDTTAERPLRAWTFGTNTALPHDISVQWAQEVSDDFHARFSAHWRRYRYIISNRPVRSALLHHRATWWRYPLDAERMHRAAQHLVGEHDFSTYRAVACQAHSPVRTIHAIQVQRHGDLIVLEVRANAFLQHMVRNIVGVLLPIGEGEQPTDWTQTLLNYRDRTKGGITAPPDGLSLIEVGYPDFDLPNAARPMLML